MISNVNSCPICLIEFESTVYYLEGHKKYNSLHLFHPSCIREWINRGGLNCPICRDPLQAVQLKKFSNSNFSWLKYKYKWIKANSRLMLTVASGLGIAYKITPYIPNLIPEITAGILTGSGITFASPVIQTALIRSKIKISGDQIVRPKLFEKTFFIALYATTILTIYFCEVDNVRKTAGMVTGAVISSISTEFINPYFFHNIFSIQNDSHQIHDHLQITAQGSALTVGIIAMAKLAYGYSNDWGILAKTVSVVTGGILGLASSCITFISSNFFLKKTGIKNLDSHIQI